MASSPAKRRSASTALKISGIFLFLGGLWILFSDQFLLTLVDNDPLRLTRLQTVKGWVFVVSSALLLYGLVRSFTQSIHTSEEQLRLLFERSGDALLVFNSAGRIMRANRAAADMLGHSREQLLRSDLSLLNSPEAEQHLKQLDHNQSQTGEFTFIRSDRQQRIAEYTACQFSPGCYLSILRDVTDRKRAEAELRSAKELAEESSRAKDHLMAVLSHELRTPLTPVLAAVSGLLREDGISDDVRELFEMIRRNVQLEARLIDDLLDFTRIGRGTMHLELAPVDVHELIRRIAGMCRPESRQLHLDLELTAACPIVHGDSARLQQVLWNLLNNAIKFTPPDGQIAIRTRDDGRMLAIEVSDSGAGIESQELQQLFQPFQQGEAKLPRNAGGLGLGLSICKAIIAAHGGSIEAESPGRDCGATFRVRLPATAEQPVGMPPRASVAKP